MDENKNNQNEENEINQSENSDMVAEVEALQIKCDEYLNGWKRAQADYQNLVKENRAKQIELIQYANEDLIRELFPVLDNFKAAFRQIPEAEKNSAWVVGFSYIKKQLEEVMRNHNVEEIQTVGKEFNHEEHEAVEHVKKEGVKSNEIIEERKSGYRLNGKVIQVAKVVVAE